MGAAPFALLETHIIHRAKKLILEELAPNATDGRCALDLCQST
jgi:hypothetical protein